MNQILSNHEVEELLTSSPYHQFLGVHLVESNENSLTICLPFKNTFITGEDGYIHGGIIATIIDIAGYFAIFQRLNQPNPTIDLRVDYLRVARKEDLYAKASVVKIGKSVSVADVVVTNKEGKQIAIGRGLFNTKQI
ncbi:PaaI family thioesterase [Neobacillus sp. FSL H8-0543]|uniref:PaaI family thioesterase n=1 Tax=Neobacillus sp. FSL H8-0543 TaxID=2954672 RepID=UPI003158E2FA